MRAPKHHLQEVAAIRPQERLVLQNDRRACRAGEPGGWRVWAQCGSLCVCVAVWRRGERVPLPKLPPQHSAIGERGQGAAGAGTGAALTWDLADPPPLSLPP